MLHLKARQIIFRIILVLHFILDVSLVNSQAIFQKYFVGNGDDWGNSVIQNFDNGYTIAGYTNTFGTGDVDAYLIRTDSLGSLIWAKTYGDITGEIGYSVKQTPDSGFILVGSIRRTVGSSVSDVLIIKTDQYGDTLWTKYLEGQEWAVSVGLRSQGGYILTGPPKISIAAIDSLGILEWTKLFNFTNNENPYSIAQTDDGGFILTGNTKDSTSFIQEAFLMKTDSIGNLMWVKSFGGSDIESGLSAIQCSDGGYIMSGVTHSFGAGYTDVYIVKTNSSGDTTWTRAIGTNGFENGTCVTQTQDGNFVISGMTSIGFGGNNNVYLIKLDSLGNIIWSRGIGGIGNDFCTNGKLTKDGGFVLVGPSRSLNPLNNDIYLIKTDSSGAGGCNEYSPNTSINYTNTIVQNPNFFEMANPITSGTPVITVGQGVMDTILCNTATNYFLAKSDNFIVFPNPSSGIISLNNDNYFPECFLIVTNLLSEKIFEKKYEPCKQILINLEKSPPGVYLINIFDNKNLIGKQMIVISK